MQNDEYEYESDEGLNLFDDESDESYDMYDDPEPEKPTSPNVLKRYDYLKPKPFFEEIVKSLIADEPTDMLWQMFWSLSEKNVMHYRFKGYYHLREDMVSRGTIACLRGFRNFKPLANEEWSGDYIPEYHHTTCNAPFGYFTMVVRNEFKQCIKEDYNQRNIVNQMKVENGLEPDHGYEDVLKRQEEQREAK